MSESIVILRMQNLIAVWEQKSDDRSIFLNCYRMMTEKMMEALEGRDFRDPIWVGKLLERFSEHYFIALQAYDENPFSAPLVWQIAHDFAQDRGAWALQKLLLGVNAHINYDLVLTLDELLATEWEQLTPEGRADRHWDFCYVNDIINQTIDVVQDQVLEPAMPWMDLFDKLLGHKDERMISSLLKHWRDKVWDSAMTLLESSASGEHAHLVQQVEADALKTAKAIKFTDLTTWFDK